MSIPLIVNGVTYNFPAPFDTNWAPAVDAWATAITNGLLQKAGGSFPLTAEVDFGNSFGIRAKYIKSEESNVSSTGFLRLANQSIGIGFRDFANTTDLILTTNASNELVFNGIPIGPLATLTNGHIFVGNVSNQPADVAITGDIGISNTGLTTIQAGAVTNAKVNASAAIAVTKLAAVTANRALASDSSGFITPSVTTDTELGYVSGVTSSIQTQLNTIPSSSSTFQPGDMKAAGYTSVPSGWLLCDGTSYLRASFPNLFSAIGTTYGSADGTHFNVPNMVNAVPIGAGSIAAIGVTTGSATGTVSITDPGHTHTQNAHHHTGTSGGVASTGFSILSDTGTPEGVTTLTRDIGEVAISRAAAQTVAFVNTGATTATENSSTTGITATNPTVQPSLGVTWFIKI